jgi:serine protease SohB
MELTMLADVSLDVISFFIKAAIIVAGIAIIIGLAIKEKSENKITVKDLNKRFRSYRRTMTSALFEKKKLKKELKKIDDDSKHEIERPRTYVLHFNGDIRASEVESLREVVTAVLCIATKDDEVVLVLESPGGMVHGYGLAASQLQRIKDAGLRLVVCVDKVAASGGYMMACLADKIVAAPFAILGSVGVVASIPNFNKILRKNDVDYYQVTSGKFKRTVSLLGEVTPEGLEKFKEEIEATHVLFKNHVKHFRPKVDVERIATGEHWYGTQARDLELVDSIGTSDDYLFKASADRILKEISFQGKKSLKDKIADSMGLIFGKIYDVLITKINQPPF